MSAVAASEVWPSSEVASVVSSGVVPARLPQMPAYHLMKDDRTGITMVNIGVGPSNAKTITDHIAVLRPHAWVMVGHCAGLRNSQAMGDFVLAHGYLREDHVLDDDLPVWMPIPALFAETTESTRVPSSVRERLRRSWRRKIP